MTVEQYNREKYLHDISNHPRYEEPEIDESEPEPWPHHLCTNREYVGCSCPACRKFEERCKSMPNDTKKLSLDELEGICSGK